ncbi:MAG: hypothetical protein ACRBG0_18675 [Lewinella sp.]|jgi:hypothetical protein|uniref:hypothetical protein n=1 Tax=Lewinella sp. TaxID=2004506 RepID=UPI003D6A6A17
MTKNKTFLTIIGFLFVVIGFLAIFLNFVGVDFAFLYWLRAFGGLGAFMTKILMVLTGFVLVYFGQVDLEKEEI